MLQPIPGFHDPFSSITHLVGAAVFAMMTIPLVRRGQRTADLCPTTSTVSRAARVTSILIFAATAVLLLSMSGVFHMLPTGPGRDVLQRLDHAAIFLLIAGTFTPIHAIMFTGVWRWGMLAFIWTIAITGVTLKSIYFTSMPESAGIVLYIAMGWIGGISILALAKRFGIRLALPILYGGVAYTIGAGLDLFNPPDLIGGVLRSHELFHVAILFGLGFHWRMVWNIAAHEAPCAAVEPTAAISRAA